MAVEPGLAHDSIEVVAGGDWSRGTTVAELTSHNSLFSSAST